MPFPASRQCQALSHKTGERCRQPVLHDSLFCRFHGPTDAPADDPDGTLEEQSKARGGQPANTNRVRHGAYAARLLPDEEAPYEEKKQLFSEALGTMDAFDEQLVHLLALVAAKVDVSSAKGAPPDAIGPLINQVVQLMRELKATRASRSLTPPGTGATFAELYAMLGVQLAEWQAADDAKREARRRKGPTELYCQRCAKHTSHNDNMYDDAVCRECGSVIRKQEAEAMIRAITHPPRAGGDQ